MSNHRRLWLIGKPDAANEDVVLDLEDLAGLPRLEELRISFSVPCNPSARSRGCRLCARSGIEAHPHRRR
jgi:hypothetical protein